MLATQGSMDKKSMNTIYQYLVTNWITIRGYPQNCLRNLTVYDFLNRTKEINKETKELTGNWKIRSRQDIAKPATLPHILTPWEVELFQFFYVNVRSSWVHMADMKEIRVDLYITRDCVETVDRTERFMLNCNGKMEAVNYSRVNTSRQQKVLGKLIKVVSGSQRISLPPDEQWTPEQLPTIPEPCMTPEQVTFALHLRFPLPTKPDEAIVSKKVIKSFLENSPAFVKVLVDQPEPTKKTNEEPKKAKKPKGEKTKEENAIQIAANAAWFRCYQKRTDLRTAYFSVNSRCDDPSDDQIAEFVQVQRWSVRGKTSKLVRQIRRTLRLQQSRNKKDPDKKMHARNTRDNTRLKMSKEGIKSDGRMEESVASLIQSQKWENLQIVNDAEDENGVWIGRGVYSTALIKKGSIVLDYHATAKKVLTKPETNQMFAELPLGSPIPLYIIFSQSGQEVYNGYPELCTCHPSKTFLNTYIILRIPCNLNSDISHRRLFVILFFMPD